MEILCYSVLNRFTIYLQYGQRFTREGTAYFVNRPRRVSDLRQPHLPGAERAYTIVQTITLRPIDYENFSEDLLADRAFLTPLAQRGEVLQCIFVTRTSFCSM